MTDAFVKLPREQPSVRRGLWARRFVLTLFAVIFVAALLNVFGQEPTESVASSPAATMRLSAPKTVRGGLFFQARLEIRALQPISEPRLVFDEGWFESMQVNSTSPQADSESSRDGKVEFSYGELAPGDMLRIWVQFEVNPAQVAKRSFAVELDDATRPIARIDRDITVLP